jgi:hypothetical protein
MWRERASATLTTPGYRRRRAGSHKLYALTELRYVHARHQVLWSQWEGAFNVHMSSLPECFYTYRTPLSRLALYSAYPPQVFSYVMKRTVVCRSVGQTTARRAPRFRHIVLPPAVGAAQQVNLTTAEPGCPRPYIRRAPCNALDRARLATTSASSGKAVPNVVPAGARSAFRKPSGRSSGNCEVSM